MKKRRYTVSLDDDIGALLDEACVENRLTQPTEIARIVSLYLQGKLVETKNIGFTPMLYHSLEDGQCKNSNKEELKERVEEGYKDIDFELEIEDID